MREDGFFERLQRDYEYDPLVRTWFASDAIIVGPPDSPRLGKPARIPVPPFGFTDRFIYEHIASAPPNET